MTVRKAILLIFYFYCFLTTAVAQYKFDKPIYINKESGLPTTNAVGHIQKGEDGYMWIGSPEGLCRFDGQSVKIYQAGSDLRHSLFDNYVWAILPVKNSVWVSSAQGISVLNTKDNTFRHYQFLNNKKTNDLKRRFDQGVNTLYKDRSGAIWIGTNDRGVCCYDEKKDDFHFFELSREKYPRLNPAVGKDESTFSITESPTNDSIIWAGTPGGLKKINKYSGEVKLYTFQKDDKDYQIALNAFIKIYYHDDGLLYTGSWAAGVNVFDPVAETFTPLVVKNQKAKKLLTDPTYNLNRKSEHEIWITTGLGLAIYDTKIKDITWFKYNDDKQDEYYGIEFIDDANRIWSRTRLGAAVFDPVIQQFSRYSFRQLSNVQWAYAFYIISDKSGNNITVCPRQTDGIYHFNKITKEWTKTLFPNHESFIKERQAIRGFVQMPSGNYLISADKGMFVFSEKHNTIAALQKNLPFNIIRRGQLLLARSGYIWMAVDSKGIVKWKPGTNDYSIYQVPSMSGDSPQWFNHFFEDSKGNIWFQTSNGLGVFIDSTNSAINFNYYKNEAAGFPVGANSFAEDKKGRVWFAGNDGLIGYALSTNPGKGMVHKFNIRDRGIQGTIYDMAADPNGHVWAYTSKEIIKINPQDLSFTTYSFQYGISEADFFHFSFLPSGEIIFGGRNEIVIANPNELKRNKELPTPYINQIQVLNQPYDFVHDGSPLKLGYKQNFFSISFSALAFTLARDVKFRYRLKGFDDWSQVTRRRFANYTNVPGGDYVFQLQAANNEGVWNPAIVELPVHIATPFWGTWLFRVSAVLLLALALYSLYRYRLRLARKKQELKWEYEKKLANVEMTALLAQMNPHFIFNSLNSIDSYIIRNESKQASEYLNNFARLMRLILQNSRSNYISLKDELVALGLYLQMESLRFKNKFSYVVDVQGDLDINATLIPPMLIQPYIENAIWHGIMCKTNGEAGKVELGIYKKDDNLLCTISDNGIGRKKAAELKERKSNSHKRSMGMQITKDRIEIINKLYNLNTSVRIYDLENENGEASGTRVELIIPI
jgi:ligand-binding sensor domain-containing protein/two-component sensor histidine kinase